MILTNRWVLMIYVPSEIKQRKKFQTKKHHHKIVIQERRLPQTAHHLVKLVNRHQVETLL